MNPPTDMIPTAAAFHATRARLRLMLIALSVWLVTPPSEAQIGPKHASTPTHQTLMDYAATNAGSLSPPLPFTSMQSTRMREGAAEEDTGGTIPYLRTLNHAYSPLNDGAFGGGTTARNEANTRWSSMVSAFVSGNLDGGDGAGAWHYLGRTSHLLQDMTSPMHVFAQGHMGIYGFSEACRFEGYWEINDSSLRSILSSIGGPMHSSTWDSRASEKLDTFTGSTRLTYRFNNSCPNRSNDDVRGWMEVLAWITYFRATFWGEVTMGSSTGNGAATTSSTTSTTFSDGTVSSQLNVLHTMFNGNVRWINAFLGDDYYEITDRNGYVFRFMSQSDIDDWAACGQAPSHGGWAYGEQDSSIRVGGSDDDSDGVRVTGRFWFDTRELGKDTSGDYNRYCYPNYYPDGTSMTDHLHQYYGTNLYPLTVRYNAGLLGLANRRVTVKTADATQANGFSWGRRDNFGNPDSAGNVFSVDSGGSNFCFVAKSSVTLTAPASNSGGLAFVRWLRDGSTFSGNTSLIITINDSSLWIPASGVTYTAEYQSCVPALNPTSANFGSGAGSGNFSVTAAGGCSWSAIATQNWIHTTSGGSGNGTVNYTVDVNAETARVGTITVGGQAFTIYQEGQIVPFTYTTNNGTITITGYTGSGGAVTIPSTIYGLPVTTIGNNAFYNKSALTSVTIPNGVTTIQWWAFANCVALKSVTIPDSVTTIGHRSGWSANNYGAFQGCTGLTNVIIGNGVTNIGNSAFNGCTGLKSVAFGCGITRIGSYAFYNCGLTSLTIPDCVSGPIENNAFQNCAGLKSVAFGCGITRIGPYAFSSCGLTSLTIPGCVWGPIENNAFQNCPALTNAVIGNGVTAIWSEAFSGCSALNSVTLGNSITLIDWWAFYNCTALKSLTIPDSVTTIGHRSGWSANNYGAFQGCTGLTNVIIGNGVTGIGEAAFYNCTGLKSVTFGCGITRIGSYAFYNCGLTSLTIPDCVSGPIENNAFQNCAGLKSVAFGCGITRIGPYAFSSCGLTSLTIPDCVSGPIENNAFQNCPALTNAVTGNGVTAILSEAFSGCSALSSVTLGNSITLIDWWAFYNCTALKSLTIPDSVTTIGHRSGWSANNYGAFQGCTGLTNVIIGNGVTGIGEAAFYNCTGLKSVTCGCGITSIGSYAFYNCGLTSLTIPDCVSGPIENNAFQNCAGLKSVAFGCGITRIGPYAFSSCGLTSLTIPGCVSGPIENNAFQNCPALTNAVIGNGVTAIWSEAFSGCSALNSVTLGNSITLIDWWAFYNCTALKSLTIPDSVTTIGHRSGWSANNYGAFQGCTGLTNVIIGNGVTGIGEAAFYNCTGLKSVTFGCGITRIGSYAFYNCGLTSLTIPDCVSGPIENNAFQNCAGLKSVAFGCGITRIGPYAFSSCGLTSLTIPDCVWARLRTTRSKTAPP